MNPVVPAIPVLRGSLHYAGAMTTRTRNNTPVPDTTDETDTPDETDAAPEPTTVRVTAPLALAGLFQRDETRTVERTPFVENLIANGKLVVQED